MDELSNCNYYIYNDNNISLILDKNSSHDTKSHKDLLNMILNMENSHIALYLLKNFKPKCHFIDNQELSGLRKFIKQYKLINRFHDITSFDEIMVNFIINSMINNIDIEHLIRCVGLLTLNEKHIIYFRSFFGYSQIYKYYKKMNESFYTEKYTYLEISMVMRMLDNPILCFNNLLPMFSRVTKYVKELVIEKNIVKCCGTLRAVINHSNKMLLDKGDYFPSLISFLVTIFYDSTNFRFISLTDTKTILRSIEDLVNFSKQNAKMRTITFGIYKECYKNLKDLIIKKSSVYEDNIALSSLIKILSIFLKSSYELGARMYNYDDIFDFIQNLEINKPSSISLEEWDMLISSTIKYKYEILDFIYPYCENSELNLVIFRNDLLQTDELFKLLDRINCLVDAIDWETIIDIACSSEYSNEFIKFVFNEKFFIKKSKKRHQHYAELYLDSLYKSNNVDAMILSSHYAVKNLSNHLSSPISCYILAVLYCYNLDNSIDLRIIKRREMILSIFMEPENSKHLNEFFKNIVNCLLERKLYYLNKNIIELFMKLSHHTYKCEDILRLIEYLVTSISHNFNFEKTIHDHTHVKIYDKKEHLQLISEYISVAAIYLIRNDIKMNLNNIKADETYIESYLLISLVSYYKGSYGKEYYKEIKDKILENIFYIKKQNFIAQIGFLLNKIDATIKTKGCKFDIIDVFDKLNDNRE
ncbi:hypothetical protein TCON_0915 [Astathelohania contejeani]|uniref:Uncharacterized protein n=1 Tax=Astathelohania contejeani TaxID=164912 RepID=A0ABQ7I092_9MICR|nr:hypothetical protein TCON_0915 [Thelohania contejeani]